METEILELLKHTGGSMTHRDVIGMLETPNEETEIEAIDALQHLVSERRLFVRGEGVRAVYTIRRPR